MAFPITCIFKGPMDLGEGPLWHPDEQALYWLDLFNASIYRLDWKTQQHTIWKLPCYIGALGICANDDKGNLIASLNNYVAVLNFADQTIIPVANLSSWDAALRMNDGKCDRHGRFWFGVANVDIENPKGGLYCLDNSGHIQHMEREITISNGLGFSPDNKIFYYTDGLKYRIYQYDFDLATGTIQNRRIFLQLEKSPVEPDGLTIDEEGLVWEAQWNSGKVFCFNPSGHVEHAIVMPVLRPTSCIFGGPNLDILLVTSCSRGFGESTRLASPAGGIFAIEVGKKGLPEPGFSW